MNQRVIDILNYPLKLSYYNWHITLEFLNENLNDLDTEEKQTIYNRCEWYRIQHNNKKPTDIIKIEDVLPYINKELIFKEHKELYTEVNLPTDPNNIDIPIPCTI